MKAHEQKKKKKYKITVTKSYWVKKESFNYVEAENVDIAMEQVEKDYENELLSWGSFERRHEGTDWGIEELTDDDE